MKDSNQQKVIVEKALAIIEKNKEFFYECFTRRIAKKRSEDNESYLDASGDYSADKSLICVWESSKEAKNSNFSKEFYINMRKLLSKSSSFTAFKRDLGTTIKHSLKYQKGDIRPHDPVWRLEKNEQTGLRAFLSKNIIFAQQIIDNKKNITSAGQEYKTWWSTIDYTHGNEFKKRRPPEKKYKEILNMRKLNQPNIIEPKTTKKKKKKKTLQIKQQRDKIEKMSIEELKNFIEKNKHLEEKVRNYRHPLRTNVTNKKDLKKWDDELSEVLDEQEEVSDDLYEDFFNIIRSKVMLNENCMLHYSMLNQEERKRFNIYLCKEVFFDNNPTVDDMQKRINRFLQQDFSQLMLKENIIDKNKDIKTYFETLMLAHMQKYNKDIRKHFATLLLTYIRKYNENNNYPLYNPHNIEEKIDDSITKSMQKSIANILSKIEIKNIEKIAATYNKHQFDPLLKKHIAINFAKQQANSRMIINAMQLENMRKKKKKSNKGREKSRVQLMEEIIITCIDEMTQDLTTEEMKKIVHDGANNLTANNMKTLINKNAKSRFKYFLKKCMTMHLGLSATPKSHDLIDIPENKSLNNVPYPYEFVEDHREYKRVSKDKDKNVSLSADFVLYKIAQHTLKKLNSQESKSIPLKTNASNKQLQDIEAYMYSSILSNKNSQNIKSIITSLSPNEYANCKKMFANWFEKNKHDKNNLKILYKNLSKIHAELQSQTQPKLPDLTKIFPKEVVEHTVFYACATARSELKKYLNDDNELDINSSDVNKIITKCLNRINSYKLYNRDLTQKDFINIVNNKVIKDPLVNLLSKHIPKNEKNIAKRKDFKGILNLLADYKAIRVKAKSMHKRKISRNRL